MKNEFVHAGNPRKAGAEDRELKDSVGLKINKEMIDR